MLQSRLQSGKRAGYDDHKRNRGSKMHIAVDTLGHLLALYVPPAEVVEQSVEVAFVDQGYTGDQPAQAAQGQEMELKVIRLSESKRGFVFLP